MAAIAGRVELPGSLTSLFGVNHQLNPDQQDKGGPGEFPWRPSGFFGSAESHRDVSAIPFGQKLG